MDYVSKSVAIASLAIAFLLPCQSSAQDRATDLTQVDALLRAEEPFSVINKLKNLPSVGVDLFRIQNRLAEAYLLNREFTEASDLLRAQEPVASNKPFGDRAYFFLNQARLFYEISDYASASGKIDDALILLKSRNDHTNAVLQTNLGFLSGKVILQQGNFIESEKLLTRAWHYFRKDSLAYSIKIGQCHLSLGACLKAQRRTDECLRHYRIAISIFEGSATPRYYDLGRAYNNMGNAFNDLLFDYKNAQSCYLKALDIKTRFSHDSLSLAVTHSNLGRFYLQKGNYLKAQYHFERSIALCDETQPRVLEQLPTMLNNYASILVELDQLEKAEACYTRSINYIIKKDGPHSAKLMAPYLSLGGVYRELHNSTEVERVLNAAQIVLQENFNEDDLPYAGYFRLKGGLKMDQDKPDESIDFLTKAFTIYAKHSSEKSGDAIQVLLNLGMVKLRKGNYVEAIPVLKKVVAAAHQSFGEDHFAVRRGLNAIGFAFLKLQQLDSSEYYYTKAINANRMMMPGQASQKSDSRILEYSDMIESYVYLSEVYQQKHKTSRKPEDLVVASRFVDLGNDLIESIRRNMEGGADQIAFNQRIESFYEQALSVYYQLYQVSPDPRYLRAAFKNFEFAKAQSLAQSLKKLKLNSFAGVSQSLTERENLLTDRIRHLDDQLVQQLSAGNKPNQDLLNEYATDYQAARETYGRLTDSIKHNLPDYYQFKYDKNLIEVEDVQKEIIRGNKGVAVIEYLVGDSSLYCQVVTQGKSELLKFGRPKSIKNRIVSLRNQVRYKMDAEFYPNSSQLYRELFFPVDSLFRAEHLAIEQLIIIPDNILNYLPFEILVKNEGNSRQLPHFLVSDYRISYSYSCTLLWQKTTDVSIALNAHHSFVGFAPLFQASPAAGVQITDAVTRDNNSDSYFQSFQPLQSNVEEVAQISESFKKQKDESLVLKGSEASESNLFKKNMADYGYIHFATHGFVDMDRPQYSGIAFTRNLNSVTPGDGILFTSEVYKLRLKAELVCISSCDSGLGRLYKGEGIVGLSRAFLYAGARNLTVSLWKVDDLATSQLMIEYYKGIENGKTLSFSLTQAKRKMLASEKFHHPYYWASFILVGQ